MPIQRLLDWSIWLYNSNLPFLPNSDRVHHCQRYLNLRLVPHGYLRDWLHGHCLFYLLRVLSFLDNLDWLYHSQLRHPRCKHRLCSWQWINHVWLDLLDDLRHWLLWLCGHTDLPKRWYLERAVRLYYCDLWHARDCHRLHHQLRRDHVWLHTNSDLRGGLHRHGRQLELPGQRRVDVGVRMHYCQLLQLAQPDRLHHRIWFVNLPLHTHYFVCQWLRGQRHSDLLSILSQLDFGHWLYFDEWQLQRSQICEPLCGLGDVHSDRALGPDHQRLLRHDHQRRWLDPVSAAQL